MTQRAAPRMWFPLTSEARQAPSLQTTMPSLPQPRPIIFKQNATHKPQSQESNPLPHPAVPVASAATPSSTSASPVPQLPRPIATVVPMSHISTPSHPTAPVTTIPFSKSTYQSLQLPRPITTPMPTPIPPSLHQAKLEAKHESSNLPIVDNTTVFVRKTVKDNERNIAGTYNPNTGYVGKQGMINKEKDAKAKADQHHHKRSIIIEGQNKGAFIEVIHYPNLQEDNEWKSQNNYRRTAAAFTNSNVQGINNSIVSFSTFTNLI